MGVGPGIDPLGSVGSFATPACASSMTISAGVGPGVGDESEARSRPANLDVGDVFCASPAAAPPAGPCTLVAFRTRRLLLRDPGRLLLPATGPSVSPRRVGVKSGLGQGNNPLPPSNGLAGSCDGEVPRKKGDPPGAGESFGTISGALVTALVFVGVKSSGVPGRGSPRRSTELERDDGPEPGADETVKGLRPSLLALLTSLDRRFCAGRFGGDVSSSWDEVEAARSRRLRWEPGSGLPSRRPPRPGALRYCQPSSAVFGLRPRCRCARGLTPTSLMLTPGRSGVEGAVLGA